MHMGTEPCKKGLRLQCGFRLPLSAVRRGALNLATCGRGCTRCGDPASACRQAASQGRLASRSVKGQHRCRRPTAVEKKPMPRPNILFLWCDQLNASVLGAYGGPVPTPNLDRLANAGVVFDNATCPTPFCSPSRASLETGRYPHSHGITHNVNRWDYPAIPAGPTEEGIKADEPHAGQVSPRGGVRDASLRQVASPRRRPAVLPGHVHRARRLRRRDARVVHRDREAPGV